jgi:hypothetical protein
MKGKIYGVGSLVLAVFAFAAMASAEDAKIGSMTLDELKKALGMSIYLQGGYTYNGHAGTVAPSGDTEQNDLRVFDHKANSFALDIAQIVFAKDPVLGNTGYKLKLSAGETAKWIHSRGLSGAPLTAPQAGEGTDSLDITEGYVSYNAAIGKGLRFDLGKMVTYHGAEVIEAIDDVNYSRSFLFNYAIPFTHTGLKISYTFSDALNASVHIVNGWDNSTDNNKGKTYGLSVGFTPAEAFSTIVNLMSGPEQDNNNSNKRDLVDVVVTIKPVKKLSLILNGDYGREQNAVAGNAEPAVWSGVSGIAKYEIDDKYSVAVRAESFRDPDKFRTSTPTFLGASHVKEVTFTPEVKLAGGLILRPEYRHDWSDDKVFDNSTKKSQDTIALGAMYRW